MKRFITVEVLTSLATAALVCAAGALFLRRYAPRQSVPRVLQGTRLPALGGYNWASHEHTLVLALREGCPYCQDSLPFYERLLHLEDSRRCNAHIVAMFPGARAAPEGSPTSGLRGTQILRGVDLAALGVVGTPTLLLVDQSGRVERVWRGRLVTAEENEVIRAIASTGVPALAKQGCADEEGCGDGGPGRPLVR